MKASLLIVCYFFGSIKGKEGSPVSVAGIHVYSPEYKVAVLGNITTVTSHRKKGYARQATAKTCQSLLKDVSYIGLNAKAINDTAISCYKRLGFDIVATYGEYMVQNFLFMKSNVPKIFLILPIPL